ncbi:histidine ammonia-lyase-like [Diadema antillarum]|uniref:histidine ammonia-lyase-like n=1 Tax=Diadema antillarum TaxID=105358 RepID=UPI003A84F81F
MRVNARMRGEWILIPCKSNKNTVDWLGKESLSRYRTMKNYVVEDEVFEIRKTQGGSLLFPDDLLVDILEDNDFVHIVLQSDVSNKLQSDMDILSMDTTPLCPEMCATCTCDVDIIYLDGCSLSPEELVQLGRGERKIELTSAAWEKVSKARDLVSQILKENKVVYGINTGFGKFARVVIAPEKLRELQENLIRSHCVGVGQPLSPEHTRKLLALRINILAKGHSGISVRVLGQMIDAFNASCLSVIPCKGTVGASGDLAPLSHLALGLMGEGKMWSPKSGYAEAKDVLKAHGLTPIELGPKEGLALINGTQMITALGAEAVERAYLIARQADVVAALTLEVLKGTTTAFDSCIHRTRPHKGQGNVARRFKSLLHSEIHPSEISVSHRFCDRVQDAYTLRCCPQVHGVVLDTIDFVHGILCTEMNSATDNPMVFPDQGEILSAGNFHGEYPAKALDYLAIGIHELASISERRIERLVNPHLSELPAFLTKEPGLNSGFMIAHCTAAALVSENKVLTHPSSVDSLSTSAAQEDHVSMGGFSARKCLEVVEHVEQVLAIELMCACQGIDFLRPLTSTPPLEAVHKLVRSVVSPLERDRHLAPDMEIITKLLRENKVWEAVKPFVNNYETEMLKETKVPSPTSSVLEPSKRSHGKRKRTRSLNKN